MLEILRELIYRWNPDTEGNAENGIAEIFLFYWNCTKWMVDDSILYSKHPTPGSFCGSTLSILVMVVTTCSVWTFSNFLIVSRSWYTNMPNGINKLSYSSNSRIQLRLAMKPEILGRLESGSILIQQYVLQYIFYNVRCTMEKLKRFGSHL